MNATMRQGLLHSPFQLKLWTVLAALALVTLIIGGGALLRQKRHERLAIPDEKVVAAALLIQRLSGPRYFQLTLPDGKQLTAGRDPNLQGGGPRIGVEDARAQVDRIVHERALNTEAAVKIQALIEKLTEPPESRMVGDATVNLMRLNLALEELR